MNKFILCLAFLAGTLLAQNKPLANGVYAVEDGSVKAKDPATRQHEGTSVVLDKADFAPLVSNEKPQVHRGADGSWLLVQLAPEPAKRLENLTRSHMNHRLAVVVDDKILSMPTVRSVIQDGKARVTPCQDEACETLLRLLSK